MADKGKLYVCGTPIGNLDDITFRALKVLKEVELIAAEDTRRAGQLTNYYQIKTALTSYHEHNEKEKTPQLLQRLKQGEDIALVSDAGMPGISDPGREIISRAIAEGVEIIPVPGPTAAISALVVSGLSMERFVFEGFLPRKGKERQERLDQIVREERTVIIYESPYRLKDTLDEFRLILEERKIAVVREISKFHEEKIYGTAAEILARIKEREIKGEIVIIIEGRQLKAVEKEGWEELTILQHLNLLIENGYTKKEAIKQAAEVRGLPRKEVYKEAIAIDVQPG